MGGTITFLSHAKKLLHKALSVIMLTSPCDCAHLTIICQFDGPAGVAITDNAHILVVNYHKYLIQMQIAFCTSKYF